MFANATEWNEILIQCGVKPFVAARWSVVFATVVTETTFSGGEREVADFLGQVLHESANLTVLSENLNYSEERIVQLASAAKPGTRWASLLPRAKELAHDPQAFANAIYGGRMGNTDPNDGWLYRGRGPIQVTGKNNYRILGEATAMDLVAFPEMLEDPTHGLEATIAFWNKNIPDEILGDVEKITMRVQGGSLGLRHREELTAMAYKAIVA